MRILLACACIVIIGTIAAIIVIPFMGTGKDSSKTSAVGPPCFPDISNCDISGNYSLSSTDVSPYFYSASLPISQDDLPPSEVALAPYFYFYTSSNTYIFRAVGSGIWDGDSLMATIHGKLRLASGNYPAMGGFSITLKLDAKRKTYTSPYYYSGLSQMALSALDGTMVLSDSSGIIFTALNTTAKVMFVQF